MTDCASFSVSLNIACLRTTTDHRDVRVLHIVLPYAAHALGWPACVGVIPDFVEFC